MSRHRCDGPGVRAMQYRKPDWEPLVEAVGERLAEGFMWMQEDVLDDGTSVHGYKHVCTRRYLYLSDGRTAYAGLPCGYYRRQRLDYAIENALCSWWLLGDWEEADRLAVIEAVSSLPEEAHHDDAVDQLFT